MKIVKIKQDYVKSLKVIADIYEETKDINCNNKKYEYFRFLNESADWILKLSDYEKNFDSNYVYSNSFEKLLKQNKYFYGELYNDNYLISYANPTFCVEKFGDGFGQLLSYFRMQLRQYINYSHFHKIFISYELNNVFINAFDYIRNNEINYETLKDILTAIDRSDKTDKIIINLKEQYAQNFQYYTDIINNHNLSDIRYLFNFTGNITDNEIMTANFLVKYPEEKIIKLADNFVKAYLTGFKLSGKNLSSKTTVNIIYNLGQEKIIKCLIQEFNKHNLTALISMVNSTPANRQYYYDHKFDDALYLNPALIELCKSNYEESYAKTKDITSKYSGTVFIEKFGEVPFSPKQKKESLKMSDEQKQLKKIQADYIVNIMNKYIPRTETSFSILAFPTPEIGDNFDKIFDDMFRINMLSDSYYKKIQQKVIDILDKADYVHIKGLNNKTDIKIKLQKINNAEKETNFNNCGASVNIPVGEVFTTPMLTGTNGTLHINEIYLKNYNYKDLLLKFKDGYISEFSCKNYENDADNIKYIKDNLLYPFSTLPVGEFAIGTNTLAYALAKKYNIMDKLPILVIEKMGPHIAIGDTCYSFTEDKPEFNEISKKEIISRDNEKSILRKTDKNNAYTYHHTDITIPYESIEFITAVTEKEEKYDIIRNGFFVLEGTEELNKPLYEIKDMSIEL